VAKEIDLPEPFENMGRRWSARWPPRPRMWPGTERQRPPCWRSPSSEKVRADYFETKDGLTVVADLPGVEQKALDVRVADGILTLQRRTAHVAPGTPIEREYDLLHFYRQFELPEEVDAEKIGAEIKHSVLTLCLPKKEKTKPRRIDVSVG
jgi:HSP20 family protein